MRLPGDEHEGWDRLIAAVVDSGSDAETTGQAAATPNEGDLVALLDLAALQDRAGALAGDGDHR